MSEENQQTAEPTALDQTVGPLEIPPSPAPAPALVAEAPAPSTEAATTPEPQPKPGKVRQIINGVVSEVEHIEGEFVNGVRRIFKGE